MMRVNVQFAVHPDHAPAESEIQEWANASFRNESHGELTVRVVDLNESARLNKEFRRRPGPTNVLSFPADWSADDGGDYFGDIAICADLVEFEALEQLKSVRAHWAHLVVHGVLHLLGYDHQSSVEAETMETVEAELLQSFGFPNPYYRNAVGQI